MPKLPRVSGAEAVRASNVLALLCFAGAAVTSFCGVAQWVALFQIIARSARRSFLALFAERSER